MGQFLMKSKKSIILSAILLLTLGMSLTANFVLYSYSKQYYRQLNGQRLDPLGINNFLGEMESTEPDDSTVLTAVFFGDSRAAQWPAPHLKGVRFVNRGIGAQTSTQVAQRYEAHVAPLRPDIVVVQVCINDLKTIPLFPTKQAQIVAECKANIEQIVRLANQQGATVIVTTVFPVGRYPIERRLFWSEAILTAVDEVNQHIKSLENERVIIFDAFTLLANQEGRLAQAYSLDELHLTAAGYDALNVEFVEILRDLWFADQGEVNGR